MVQEILPFPKVIMSVDHVGKPTVVPCSWPNGKKDNAITGLMEAFAAQVKSAEELQAFPAKQYTLQTVFAK